MACKSPQLNFQQKIKTQWEHLEASLKFTLIEWYSLVIGWLFRIVEHLTAASHLNLKPQYLEWQSQFDQTGFMKCCLLLNISPKNRSFKNKTKTCKLSLDSYCAYNKNWRINCLTNCHWLSSSYECYLQWTHRNSCLKVV